MRKRVVSTLVAGGTALGAYVAADENRRKKMKNYVTKFKHKLMNSETKPIEKAGYPEKDHHENSKMVSEGSQFGVQYYNHAKEEDKSITK